MNEDIPDYRENYLIHTKAWIYDLLLYQVLFFFEIKYPINKKFIPLELLA